MDKLILSLTNNGAIRLSVDTFRTIKNLDDLRRLSEDLIDVIRKLNAINANGIQVSASLSSGYLDELAEQVLGME